jgi:hypothetical protein
MASTPRNTFDSAGHPEGLCVTSKADAVEEWHVPDLRAIVEVPGTAAILQLHQPVEDVYVGEEEAASNQLPECSSVKHTPHHASRGKGIRQSTIPKVGEVETSVPSRESVSNTNNTNNQTMWLTTARHAPTAIGDG